MSDLRKTGWVRLHRASLDSSVWPNCVVWQVWCWCLLKANHQTKQFPFNGEDLTLLPGQFISSHDSALKDMPRDLTLQKLRTAWEYLKSTNRITIKSTNKFSIITITKWEDYQTDNIQTNKPVTNEQQTSNKPVTLNKNDKNYKNVKNEKKYLAFAEEDFIFPKLWAEQAKLHLERWVNFKAASGTAKLKSSYQAEIDLYADKPREYARLVERAIINGWKGLNAQISFEPNGQGVKEKKSVAEKNIEVLNEILQESKDYEIRRNGANPSESVLVLPELKTS